MRAYATLTLLVSLTQSSYAQDWISVHNSAIDAVNRSDFSNAVPILEKCLELAATVRRRAITENDLGVALHQSGQDQAAEGHLQKSLDIWKTLPDEPMRYAQTTGALATVKRLLGSYGDAERLLRAALAREGLNQDSRSYLLELLGDLLREEGQYTEARNLLKESVDLSFSVSSSVSSDSSWKQQLNSLIAKAELDRDTHNWADSQDEWNRASDLAHRNGYAGAEAACARGLGQTWLDQHNLARAEPLLKSALAAFESQGRRDDAQVSTTLMSLGQLYLAEQKPALAEDFLNRALRHDEKLLGAGHPQLALVLEALAESFAIRNQAELARVYMDRAQRIIAARFGDDSSVTAGVWATWGSLEKRMNHPDMAVQQFRRALDSLKSPNADVSPLRTQIVIQYADVLKATHHKREAAELLASVKSFR
jgi:tetratricopeptide (TPR) repeat protein